ncbi:MAG TPA: HAD family hydrolase [Caulobacteraceae bacterium]|jgi:putative hydrolase of the HAD superfamily|nr:HAD family hydrolase [Caulobacteraceae bacterium]
MTCVAPFLPRAILFDLDDTILSAYSRPEAAWLAVAQELAESIAPLRPADAAVAIADYARAFWADPDRHREHRQDLRTARREIVGGALAQLEARGRSAFAADVAVRLADRFTDYRDEQMKLFPGAHETLDALKTAGVRLALVTNGDGPGQRRKVERFELAGRFDHIQIEGEHGFGKPEERAYLHALEALGAEAHETWMVGDNLEWEVAAPQRLGIFAIWHDPLGQGLPPDSSVRPDRIIARLEELLKPPV